jgi:hypothetical protein
MTSNAAETCDNKGVFIESAGTYVLLSVAKLHKIKYNFYLPFIE